LTRGSRNQQIAKANPTKKLGSDAIGDRIHDLCAILRGIDVHPEGSFTVRCIDYVTIASATAETSAFGGTIAAKPLSTWSAKLA